MRAAASGGTRTPHGNVVTVPGRSARKHPIRPIAIPSAVPGISRSPVWRLIADDPLRDHDSRVRAGESGEKTLAAVVEKPAERRVVSLGEIAEDEAVAREDRCANEATGNMMSKSWSARPANAASRHVVASATAIPSATNTE